MILSHFLVKNSWKWTRVLLQAQECIVSRLKFVVFLFSASSIIVRPSLNSSRTVSVFLPCRYRYRARFLTRSHKHTYTRSPCHSSIQYNTHRTLSTGISNSRSRYSVGSTNSACKLRFFCFLFGNKVHVRVSFIFSIVIIADLLVHCSTGGTTHIFFRTVKRFD